MNFDACKIYKGRKLIEILPCKFVERTNLCDEHFLITNKNRIKVGYILEINNQEKFYVTDIRVHRFQNYYVEIYFETVTQHLKNNFKKFLKVLTVAISIITAFVSIISFFM